jgi:hypothetical protein
MLQLFYLNVAYVAVAMHVCCKYLFRMFHLLQTYVAIVLSECCICCSSYTHMLQAYVPNVSSASDVCCKKCFHVESVSWVGVGGTRRWRQSLYARYGYYKSRSKYSYVAMTSISSECFIYFKHIGRLRFFHCTFTFNVYIFFYSSRSKK